MIPFLDLAADFAEVEADARRRIDGVLARQQFVLGPETAALEDAMRSLVGVPAAVAVSSGTEALALALAAVGVGPGTAVVVPAFTFFATAGAVARLGAVPVFADIDPQTACMDGASLEAALARRFEAAEGGLVLRDHGARLVAVVPVHLYGRLADMGGITALAARHGAAVVEDAAQAIGARAGGTAAGAFGLAGCFSFYPTKNLGGAGDGGLVTTRDVVLGQRVARLRTHGGRPGSYEHDEVGTNARMAELAAAVLVAKLARLEAWTGRRREVAARYRRALAPLAERGVVLPPEAAEPEAHVWHQHAIRIVGEGRRDHARRVLADAGIDTAVFYPLPLHLQPCFRSLGYAAGDLSCSEAASHEVLCLPIRPSLGDADVDEVASRLAGALA